jgi:hypothetical protein
MPFSLRLFVEPATPSSRQMELVYPAKTAAVLSAELTSGKRLFCGAFLVTRKRP